MAFSPILYPSTLVLFFLLIKIGMGNKKTRTPFQEPGF
ncbi:putative membrane protein [Brevibacillus laterosporus GI-9]|nr:putative membrane protein [Brevibacillus laterosporus GI-9]